MATRRVGKAVGGLTVLVLVAIAVWIGTNGYDNTEPVPPPPAGPELPAEPELPGEPFEASGTMAAFRGAPGLPINIWDNPDRSSHAIRVVGQIRPGQSVTITRRFHDSEEDEFYYRVGSGELVGWVPESLVNVDQELVW